MSIFPQDKAVCVCVCVLRGNITRCNSLTVPSLCLKALLSRECWGGNGPSLQHICSLIAVLELPPSSCGNCYHVLLSEQDYCPQSTTQGTNVNEILWTSSSAAETEVINSQGYFQATLVRFAQPRSERVWAQPPCGIWLQNCTANTQRDEPVNCSSLCPAPRPSNAHLSGFQCVVSTMSTHPQSNVSGPWHAVVFDLWFQTCFVWWTPRACQINLVLTTTQH